MKTCLVSVCSTIDPPRIKRYHQTFLYSAKKFGFDPIIYRSPWNYDHFRNISERLYTLKTFIEDQGKEYDIIICSDAYDVVFQLPKEELIKRFLEFNSSIVCGSELNCWPRADRDKHRYPKSPTPYAYVNGGFIVGYRNELLQLLNSFTQKEIETAQTDQDLLSAYFVEQREPRITLDYYQQLSHCLNLANGHLLCENNIYRNIITNIVPCILHSNCDKRYMDPIIETVFPEIDKLYPERLIL